MDLDLDLEPFITDWKNLTSGQQVDAASQLIRRLLEALQSTNDEETRCQTATRLWWLIHCGYSGTNSMCYRVLELISSQNTAVKSIGYQILAYTTPVSHEGLLLALNLLKKDLTSSESELALAFLAECFSPVLHSALSQDVLCLFYSNKPLVRKKAIAAMITSLRLGATPVLDIVEHVRDKLDDNDQGVLNLSVALVQVAGEIDPNSSLVFLPTCVRILETTRNVILASRILSVLGCLSKADMRVGLRVEGLLKRHVEKPLVKVTQYEAASTLACLVPPVATTLRVAIDYIMEMLNMPDPNLRYCGLELLDKIGEDMDHCGMRLDTYPRLKIQIFEILDSNVPSLWLKNLRLFRLPLLRKEKDCHIALFEAISKRHKGKAAAWGAETILDVMISLDPEDTLSRADAEKYVSLLIEICSHGLPEKSLMKIVQHMLHMCDSNKQWQPYLLKAAIALANTQWLHEGSDGRDICISLVTNCLQTGIPGVIEYLGEQDLKRLSSFLISITLQSDYPLCQSVRWKCLKELITSGLLTDQQSIYNSSSLLFLMREISKKEQLDKIMPPCSKCSQSISFSVPGKKIRFGSSRVRREILPEDSCFLTKLRPLSTTLTGNMGDHEPKLPYDYKDLEPHISQETLKFHFDKHHMTYWKKFNELIKKPENKDYKDLLHVIKTSKPGPLFNNAAQVVNHNLYWLSMKQNKDSKDNKPTGVIAKLIDRDFKSFDEFKSQFSQSAAGHFGSGWAWLVWANGKLSILDTHDADNPIKGDRGHVILVCDVWEHAYYIDYRNDRGSYVEAWWKVINWDYANENLKKLNVSV